MLTFNVFDATFEYDEQDPEPFRGGHKTTNRGDEPVRLLMFADANPVGYSCYPDSNKITHWTDSTDPAGNVLVRRGENLDYWDGEL